MKKCQFCAEKIQDDAIKCKHCGSILLNGPAAEEKATKDKILGGLNIGAAIVSLIIPGTGQMVKGEIGTGIVFLVLAIGFGSFTFGIGWIFIGLISSISALFPSCICPNCRTNVSSSALICKHCQTVFTKGNPAVNPKMTLGKAIVVAFLGVGLVGFGAVATAQPYFFVKTLGIICLFAGAFSIMLGMGLGAGKVLLKYSSKRKQDEERT